MGSNLRRCKRVEKCCVSHTHAHHARMIRGLQGTALCSKAGRRLCHTLDLGNAAATATTKEAESPKPTKETTQQARLWAMTRLSKGKKQLDSAMKAWRIPACLIVPEDSLPPGVGPLVYLDRLQVHQFYWKLGDPGFVCKKFCMDIYDPSWEKRYTKSKIIASLDVYPQRMNKNKENDIVNLLLVEPKDWGLRCPIHFFGEQQCIGLKKGGIFKKTLTYLAFDCDLDLPVPEISLDVSNLDIGEQVLIEDLNLNLELKSNLQPSTVICEVLPESSADLQPSSVRCKAQLESSA